MNEVNATTTEVATPVAPVAPKAQPRKQTATKAVKKSAKKVHGSKKVAPKATPKAGNPKGEKRTSNYREDGSLTKRAVDVLAILSKRARPSSADQVADALKLPDGSRKTVRWAIGSVRSDSPDPLSLIARKFVRAVEVEVEGRKEVLFEITGPGKTALKREQANRK
jgi:hypothetical protein